MGKFEETMNCVRIQMETTSEIIIALQIHNPDSNRSEALRVKDAFHINFFNQVLLFEIFP